MEFFGITSYGPQNYIKDMTNEYYVEPMHKDDVAPIMQKVLAHSTCPINVARPDVNVIRIIDCYVGRGNGFAYGSSQRFLRMKRKGVMKPFGPPDMYRLPPTASVDYGWWMCDPDLANSTWYQTFKRFPQPSSPNSRLLDKAKINNKYASLF